MSSLWEAPVEGDALLDLDDDATSGCTVMTADGQFLGVEGILRTTVETTSFEKTVRSWKRARIRLDVRGPTRCRRREIPGSEDLFKSSTWRLARLAFAR